jgi:hypothetical protein
MRLRRLAAAVGAMTLGLLPGSAGAATQIGETFPPDSGTCTATNFMSLQPISPGMQYAAPFAGVITSWSFRADSSPPQLKFKVARPEGANSFTIVGESGVRSPVPSQLNTFSDVRIPVRVGDVIGFYLASPGPCLINPSPGYDFSYVFGDQAPGTTEVFTPCGGCGSQLDVSASLEPDADNDGFGDETQDACPTDETTQGACLIPDTTITKGPKDKTKKKRATFEFSSSIGGATFECSLDGGAFAPCSSPHEVKVKKGQHSFAVRATAKGQTDASPASDDWKVKKKKTR